MAYQLDRLSKAGCERILREKQSGKDTKGRRQLLRLLAGLTTGDILLATVSDRIARDPLDMVLILREVENAGAGLQLLDEPFIDTAFDFADVIAYFRGWVARAQRLRILENTANGRAMAKARGVKFGRKPKLGQIVFGSQKNGPSVSRARTQGGWIPKIARFAANIVTRSGDTLMISCTC